MTKSLKSSAIISLLFFSIVQSYGQVATRSYNSQEITKTNRSLLSDSDSENVLITMPAINIEKLLKEDKELEGLDVPFNTGYIFDVDYTLKHGMWKKTDSKKIWTMKFRSKGAYYLNFTFSELKLSSDAELYISNTEGSMVYGPITSVQNMMEGAFITDLISGEEAIIQLVEPANTDKESVIRISKVVHGYRDCFSHIENSVLRNIYDATWDCHNDVNCFPIWKNESNGVAVIIMQIDGKQGHCTGSLLNNTAQNKKPYFLTAFHCIDFEKETKGILSNNEVQTAENWAFRFQFKSNTCDGNGQIVSYTYNQAYLRASWWDTDFALMELKTSLSNTSFPITFSGWNKTSNNPSKGTGIHHPKGDLMKISFCNTTIPGNINPIPWSGAPQGHYWCPKYTSGTTQAGSSGSPLFDGSKKVIGQLAGGDECCAPATKVYGKLNLSWTGGGTSSSRLSNWLDPLNKGVSSLDPLFSYPSSTTGLLKWFTGSGHSGTTSYSNNGSPLVVSRSSNTHIYLDWYVDVAGQHYPLDTNEEARLIGVSSSNSSVLNASIFDSNCISISTPSAGNANLYVKVIDGTYLHDFIIPINVLQNYSYYVYPNPATTSITIAPVSDNTMMSKSTNNSENKHIASVFIYDLMGNLIINKIFNTKAESVQLDVSSLSKGVYNIIVSDGNESSSMNVIIK
ncbi:MAG: trypsin-like peptidase domain-containing protein [Tannerella sp.]|nr:trypsin-like peptidase domain-containing protein [Tannerella sp.]